jgi:hypothetical protein
MEIRRFPGKEETTTRSVAFSPDGRMLAVSDSLNQIRVWEIASRKERLGLQGHRGPITCLAFDRACRVLASGSEDTTALVWDLTGTLTSEPLPDVSEKLWADLAEANGVRAYQTVWDLAQQPKTALPFLSSRMKPAPPVDPGRIAALIAELDADQFEIRDKAQAQLAELHERAAPALRRATESTKSREIKRRAQELLNKLGADVGTESWRQVRAVEALERMATPEARQFLKTLASGDPDARLTQEAQRAWERELHK